MPATFLGPGDRSRREFLRLIAASSFGAAVPARGQESPAALTDPKRALNVMDFEAAAKLSIPPPHFGYLTTGVDDDATLKANRTGFSRIQLRPRRLVDISHVDTRIDLLGAVWDYPIVIAPAGSQKAFHPDGELATARAARSTATLQILSTVTTCGVEDVIQARGAPVWYQLYAASRWQVTEKLIRRAEAAGCPVLVLTVDAQVGRNTETLERFRRTDSRTCAACHASGAAAYRRKPMFDGIDMTGIALSDPTMTWDFVRKLKKTTSMKVVVKGIETGQDAKLCCDYGADGIVVSNHGGRETETGRSTIECLPEVIDAVHGQIPVLIDSGFRRGTDIFKALALGARAICIGRPYLWGLGAFGQAGVERVIEILRGELVRVMQQCGTRSIGEIGRGAVLRS